MRTGILSLRRVAPTEMIASTWASRISFEVGGHQTPASNVTSNPHLPYPDYSIPDHSEGLVKMRHEQKLA